MRQVPLNSQSTGGAEEALRVALQEQTLVFEQTLELMDQLDGRQDLSTPGSMAAINHLEQMLEKVRRVQGGVSTAREKQQKTGIPLSAALQQTLAGERQRLELLLSRIETIFNKLEQARTSLVPQLDQESRRRSMQSAYQKTLRTI